MKVLLILEILEILVQILVLTLVLIQVLIVLMQVLELVLELVLEVVNKILEIISSLIEKFKTSSIHFQDSLDLEITNEKSNIQKMAYGILILSIVSLWSYLNMIQFFSVIKIEERYPKLYRYLSYYKKRTFIFVLIDIFIGIIPLIILIYFSLGVFLK